MAAARDAVGVDLIAAALTSRREELISASLDAIRSRMPAYRQADPALLEDVRRHIGEHHDLLCTVLRRGRPADRPEFAFVGRHAALRARRGISLPDFLEAFRSYHNVVYRAWAEPRKYARSKAEPTAVNRWRWPRDSWPGRRASRRGLLRQSSAGRPRRASRWPRC